MSRPKRQKLTVRVVPVPDPDADATFDLVLDILADAIAELAIREARAEVASRLGVTADQIDHEQAALHPEDVAELDRIAERGTA